MGRIEDEFEDMRKLINRMLQDAFRGRFGEFREPFVYGFSIRSGRDGRPEIREFGTARPTLEGAEIGQREPLTDVIESEEEIFVTVELPGVSEEDIDLRLAERTITLSVNADRIYRKVIDLPETVDVDSAKRTFKNGVLDIVLRKKSQKEKEIEVK